MDAKDIVREHIQRKCKLYFDDPDTVSGHIENERAVTNDYRGRVLYELIQNAVDRAESNIWIILDEEKRTLVVANDGKPFSAIVRQGEPRSDLAALCSLHTSNKKPGESIGNKGVGFKSVWEFCNSVQIKTCESKDNQGWGMRLRRPFKPEVLENWADKYSAEDIKQALNSTGIEEKHRGKVPSFYFPEYLPNPLWIENKAVTEIELENISQSDFDRLKTGPLNELLNSTLVFIGDIRKDPSPLNLTVINGVRTEYRALNTVEDEWLRIDIDTQPYFEKLNLYRAQLGFELQQKPKLTLAFPKVTAGTTFSQGKFYSYLPTEMSTGSPLHIQGDFYLSESRKNIDFSNNQFNKYLLEISVEVLIESLEQNKYEIAGLPYALQLLNVSDTTAQMLKTSLTGNGERLAKIFTNILQNRKTITKSTYTDIYKLIGVYTPIKTYFLHGDHQNKTLFPYFAQFSKENLNLVPLDFESVSESNVDPIVLRACPLSISETNIGETRLFCRRATDHLQNFDAIDAQRLVVTSWRFPEDHGLASNLKTLAVWNDYEAVSVLRAIVSAQNETTDEESRCRLLKSAQVIFPRNEFVGRTNWRFLFGEEVHPSQRLLIPVLSERGWAEVRNSFISDRHPELSNFLDDSVFPIDEDRCNEILGATFREILKYWGVWDIIPLVSAKGSRIWELPLKTFPLGMIAQVLFSDSLLIWQQFPNQSNLNNIFKLIKETEWLNVSSGASTYVAPANTYFGVPNGNVEGYYLINPDGLMESEWHFLSKLGVTSVEFTNNLEKLIITVESIAANCTHFRQIKGPLLSAYRQILRRINKILFDTNVVPDKALINRLPLFFETANTMERGIATSLEKVWYVSGSHRSTRSKMDDQDVLWWLASAEMGTLANCLDGVSTLASETTLTIDSKVHSDDAFRQYLEKEYLPVLMSLSCYGDIPGLTDIDESIIQRRWQSLSIFTVEDATLHESIGTVGQSVKEILTHITESILLWEPLRADSKKKLILYVIPEYEVEEIEFKRRLCLWFAEEVFRRRELFRYFEQVILLDMTLDEYGVTDVVLNDVRAVIHDWLPVERQNQLLIELTAILGFEVNSSNWRDLSIYAKADIPFDKLMQALTDDIKIYIEPLNPLQRNEDALLDFVDIHVSNLAALPELCELNNEDWLMLLAADVKKFSFAFSPLEWMLVQTGLSREAFDGLKGKVIYELRELQKNPEAITVNHAKPDDGNLIFNANEKSGVSSTKSSPSLIATKDNSERLKAQQANATAGKNVEDQLALLCASEVINVLSDEQKQYFIDLLKKEYQRIELFKTKGLKTEKRIKLEQLLTVDVKEHTEQSWKELIHIGDIADGAGYDVISYSPENEVLLLIEVKSSRANDPRIFLSENERLEALRYISSSFTEAYPSIQWKMYFVKEGGHYDITASIADLLCAHQQTFIANNNFLPESWIISGIEIQQKNQALPHTLYTG